jgi:hypothetical protein
LKATIYIYKYRCYLCLPKNGKEPKVAIFEAWVVGRVDVSVVRPSELGDMRNNPKYRTGWDTHPSIGLKK